MTAFAIKHVISEHGLVMANIKELRKTPYSYTSKTNEAHKAAQSNYVYVFEVQKPGGVTTYYLAYKYKATEVNTLPGSLWLNEFKYKNSSTPGDSADGLYFENPIETCQSDFNAWFKSLPPGMAEIPLHLISGLDAIFDDPGNFAKKFD